MVTSAWRGKGVDAVFLELFDEVEPVFVAAMEVNADRSRPVQTGAKGEGLTDAAVFPGAGDQDPLVLEPGAELVVEAEAVGVSAVHRTSLATRRSADYSWC